MLIELGRPWVLTLHLAWGGNLLIAVTWPIPDTHTLSTIMTFWLKHSGQSVWPEIHFEKGATVLRKPVR